MLNGWFELAVSREHDNLMLANKMNAMANRDPLTGIANRRHFDQACKRAIAQGTTQDVPLTVILLDVDFFKRYNDRYGHQAGDECLKALAKALRVHAARSGDLLARYGGEEFAMLTSMDAANAPRLGELLRESVLALALHHPGSPEGKVTISLGVATVSVNEGVAPSDLIRLADQALYAAKRGGRNRVVAVTDNITA